MIKHIVIWSIKATEDATKEQNILKFKQMLEALPADIKAIKSLEVGLKSDKSPSNNNDIVLTTTHESWEALSEYASHPKHLVVIDFAKTIVESRSAVDFEYKKSCC